MKNFIKTTKTYENNGEIIMEINYEANKNTTNREAKYNRNKKLNKQKSKNKVTKEDNSMLQSIGKMFIDYKRELDQKHIVREPLGYQKFLYVKQLLSRIATDHDTKLEIHSEYLQTYISLKTWTLFTDDLKTLNKAMEYCSAAGIDTLSNGQIELNVTIPNTHVVKEK